MCGGGGISVGLDVLSGRKINWVNAGIGCIGGALVGGAVRVLGPGGDVGTPKLLQKYTRPYLRFDAPHHGQGYHFDGKFVNFFKGFFK